MKKEQEKYEEVQRIKVEKERTVYIAEDGTKFYNEQEALDYEKKSRIPSKSFDLGVEMSGTFHYLTSLEDIHTLGFGYYLKTKSINETMFSFPGWYLFTEEAAPNGYFLTAQPLKEVREYLEDSLRNLPTDEDL